MEHPSNPEQTPAEDATPEALRRIHILEQLLSIDAADLRGALTQVSDLVAETIRSEKVDVFLKEPTAEALVAVGTSRTELGRKQHELALDRLPIPNGGRIVGVYQTGEPFLTGHADLDADELPGVVKALGVRSTLAVPVDMAAERRGVLSIVSPDVERFTEDDLLFARAVARWIGRLIQRTELSEQVSRDARTRERHAAAEEIVTTVAHDLGNLLAPIKGHVDLALRQATRASHTQETDNLRRARSGIERLDHLVHDLLDVARLEQGIFGLTLQPLDLAALVHETVEGLNIGERITLELPEELQLSGDPARIRQALENLVSNALKFSPKDRPVLIRLRPTTDGERPEAELAVIDEGPGVDTAALPRLVQRFQSSGGPAGLGLGLYLANGVAQAHGGRLSVQSDPGKGACFALHLPLAPHQLTPKLG